MTTSGISRLAINYHRLNADTAAQGFNLQLEKSGDKSVAVDYRWTIGDIGMTPGGHAGVLGGGVG